MSAFGRFWTQSAARRPLLTLALTNGAMGAAGDVIAQLISPPQPPSLSPSPSSSSSSSSLLSSATTKIPFLAQYDPWRTARFFVYGCMFAPVAHKWYSLLDRRFPFPIKAAAAAATTTMRTNTSAAAMLVTCKRVVTDQTIFAPTAIAAFFTVMGAMEGKGTQGIAAGFRESYPQALLGNYALWPAAQLINFGLVPLIYRVPFSSLVSVFWNTYLSWVNSRQNTRKTNYARD